MKKIYFLSLAVPCLLSAQGEFVAEIDISDGSYVKTGPKIPDITYVFPEDTAFDENTATFFFRSSLPTQNLYAINTADGSIVNNPIVENIIHFEYDNVANMLYGIKISGGLKRLVSYDPVSGTASDIGNTFSNGSYMQGDLAAIDETNHVYYLAQSGMVYSIDTTNGDMLSNVPLTLPVNCQLLNISFDQASGNLFGILNKPGIGKVFLVNINATAGTITEMGTGTTNGIGNGSGAIDENNQQYIYAYYKNVGYHITAFNLLNGDFISNSQISPLEPNDNMHSIEFDNTQQKLFAMHWDNLINLSTEVVSSPEFIGISPNPFSEYAFIEVPMDGRIFDCMIHDVNGKKVRAITGFKGGKLRVDKGNLTEGVYFYSLNCGNTVAHKGKFIIQ